MINLLEAVAIVLVVLTLAMGWRMGVIISTGLVLTILGTFIVMSMQGIDLQRVSLIGGVFGNPRLGEDPENHLASLAFTPDGRRILVSQLKEESDLMLVENFR